MNQFGSFSDAIRHGSTLRPQAFGAYVGPDGSTCTMGAGLHALLGRELTPAECLSQDGLRQVIKETKLFERYGYLNSEVDAPCGCKAPGGYHEWNGHTNTSKTIYNLIVHLNNIHQWTPDRIADWLQSEEDKLGYETLTISEPEQSQESALVTA